MVRVAFAQGHQEVGHRALPHLRDVLDTAVGEIGDIAAQVTSIRLQGVLGEATLDDEVVQVGADRAL